MKLIILIGAIFPLLLTGCVSPEQRARNEQAQAEAYRNALNNQCQAYGYRPGTDTFAGCIQTEHNKNLGQAQAQDAAAAYRNNAYYCNKGVAQACRAIGR